ncbi:MAG TPA: hypothetical protein VKE94_12640 [Gemmataceae bacterium]|nr:hypothetical protein [Gemmataceae bacterium]
MKTKRWLVGGLSLALILFLLNGPGRAGEKSRDTSAPRWVRVSSVGEQIVDMKKEIALDAATATKVFVKEFPHLRHGWEKHIPGKKDHYDYS